MVPNKIDFSKVIAVIPPENLVVLSTICLIFVVYAVGLVFARRADNRDKMKVGFFSQNGEFCVYQALTQLATSPDFSIPFETKSVSKRFATYT